VIARDVKGRNKTPPAQAKGRPRLRLLVRSYCHLCEEMEKAIAPLLAQARVELERIDVDEHPALEATYSLDVPVLLHGEQVLCKHRADVHGLRVWLQENC
jgi:thioredoxin reductase (NADPH)